MGAGSKIESPKYFNDYKPSQPVLKTKETSNGANLKCCKCGQRLEETTDNEHKQYHHKLGKKVFHIGECPPSKY